MLDKSKLSIDSLDRRLLSELIIDSRRSVRELAKSLGESPSTIYNRVKRLEEKNVIKNWTISLDYSAVHLNVLAFVFIKIGLSDQTGGRLDVTGIVDKLKQFNSVIEIHSISGMADLLVKIRSDSIRSLGTIILDEIRTIPGVLDTIVQNCFDSYLEETKENMFS